jgi:transposase
VPREASTGDTRKLGGITKAGNAHARWILIEAIQHAFLPPKVSAPLSLRQQGQPALVTFGPDRRPEQLSLPMILGTSVQIRLKA